MTELHLIPVGLGSESLNHCLPADVQALAGKIDFYIAENAKTARAFLKQVGTVKAIQDITIHTLSAKTTTNDIQAWLKEARELQKPVGLVSEAGCPAVADPGAKVVYQAHQMNMPVMPWVGPSSILLGLMASGLDGQRFTFHGYAPVNPEERAKQLKVWEGLSGKQQQTQLFIETPYRNDAMLESLTSHLKPDTKLCLALALTTDEQWIKTQTIKQWKADKNLPELNKKPCLFLFLAG